MAEKFEIGDSVVWASLLPETKGRARKLLKKLQEEHGPGPFIVAAVEAKPGQKPGLKLKEITDSQGEHFSFGAHLFTKAPKQ